MFFFAAAARKPAGDDSGRIGDEPYDRHRADALAAAALANQANELAFAHLIGEPVDRLHHALVGVGLKPLDVEDHLASSRSPMTIPLIMTMTSPTVEVCYRAIRPVDRAARSPGVR